MGRDKALLPYRGQTLLQAVAEAVEQAAGSVVLVGRGGCGSRRAIADLYPGEGPLGGILTALADTTAPWNLMVACDMPELTVPFLVGLLRAAEAARADALVPAGPSGRLEPLCAVYQRSARAALEAAFHTGVRRITDALAGVRVVRFPVAETRPLQNVNTPEDWSEYAAE